MRTWEPEIRNPSRNNKMTKTIIEKSIKEKEAEIVKLQRDIEELKKDLEVSDWIKIDDEWEVEKELRKPMKYKEAIELAEKLGYELMTVLDAGNIHSNFPKIKLSDDWEWIKHYSEKMEKAGYGAVVGLDSYGFLDDDRLYVNGYYWNVNDGCSFGVRFKRKIKEIQGK